MFNKKKIILSLLILLLSFTFVSCKEEVKDDKFKIVVTNFPCYDFMRAIVKGNDNVELTMLLKPGVESHSYDPTPQDVLAINNADIFCYVGGESDVWADKIVESNENEKLTILKMSDFVTMFVEEFKEGMTIEDEEDDEEEIEYDEHVWTSPKNAILIVEGFRNKIVELDPDNKSLYESNSEEYIDKLSQLDKEFRKVISNSQKKELIFGDRFPIIYFTKEYGLDYYAAFPGCSSESEVSAKTLVYLIDKIKTDSIGYVFHIELSDNKVADTLCEETNAKSLLFHTAHNVTKEEFDLGETYYSLMKGNIDRIYQALN